MYFFNLQSISIFYSLSHTHTHTTTATVFREQGEKLARKRQALKVDAQSDSFAGRYSVFSLFDWQTRRSSDQSGDPQDLESRCKWRSAGLASSSGSMFIYYIYCFLILTLNIYIHQYIHTYSYLLYVLCTHLQYLLYSSRFEGWDLPRTELRHCSERAPHLFLLPINPFKSVYGHGFYASL